MSKATTHRLIKEQYKVIILHRILLLLSKHVIFHLHPVFIFSIKMGTTLSEVALMIRFREVTWATASNNDLVPLNPRTTLVTEVWLSARASQTLVSLLWVMACMASTTPTELKRRTMHEL